MAGYDPAQHPHAGTGPGGGRFVVTTRGPTKPKHRQPRQPKPKPVGEELFYDPTTNRGTGYGGSDAQVRRLQRALNRLGLRDARGNRLTVDGRLGPLTTSSVKAAQRMLGLSPTGRVSPGLLADLSLRARSTYHRSVEAAMDKPYGDVTYADPGYRDGKARYPIDTEDHTRAAWSYINQASNAAKYTTDQLKTIKGRIKAALKRYGITVAEDSQEAYMPTDTLADAAWREAIETAVRASASRYGLDPDELLDLDPDDRESEAYQFMEGLDQAADLDAADPGLIRAVESALALHAGQDVTEHLRLWGRVVEAKGAAPDGGRVYRVRILKYGTSRNRRRYTEAVMRRAAHLYEGAKCYDHHRDDGELRSSTIRGLIGQFHGVAAEADGLYGDLHLLPSATHAAEAIDASLAAQSKGLDPMVGFSHDVHADFKVVHLPGGRFQEATAIKKVNSADLVADPSAAGIAVRALAGGTEPEGDEALDDTTEEQEDEVTTESVLAALGQATDEQLAAAGLTRASVTTTRTTEARTTETVGEPKTSFMASWMIREKAKAAGLEHATEGLAALLPARVVEADIDRVIANYKSVLAAEERTGLAPSGTVRVVRESREKVVEGLDKAFAGDYSVFRSFRQAWEAYSGRRNLSWSEDINRTILRESIGSSYYDSATRTTESMTTASWAEVLGDSITRRMVADYRQPALQSWRQIVSDIVPVNDFRTQRRTRVGGYGTLPVVNQGAPYQPLTSPTDEEATYALEKKGGTEDLTFEMIANDDLGAIRRIPIRLGLAAARTLHNFVWGDLFSANPTIYDSVALFHANHANTTAVALSQTGLSSLRQKMRDQTGYGDTANILSLVPRYLVVPNELEELAYQLVTSAVAIPATPAGPTDTPNLHQGMSHIVLDYLTDANDWFVVGDPNLCPTIEIGFYQGREEPELFTQSDPSVGSMFNADVITYKIRHMYKGAVLEYRGMQRGTQ